jgi:hypothetical protein
MVYARGIAGLRRIFVCEMQFFPKKAMVCGTLVKKITN